ncbi:MAG TPA: response regulator [Cyanothece sp. UBA12306]|nr:response regulator [Cyanothece sp. UBA12306]
MVSLTMNVSTQLKSMTESNLRVLPSAQGKWTTSSIAFQNFATLEQARLLRSLKNDQFSGRLLLRDTKGTESTVYLHLGRIIYATGGVHSGRRWQRSIIKYCPEIGTSSEVMLAAAISGNHPISWEYQLLNGWFNEQKISRDKMRQIIEAIVTELLFDLMQSSQVSYLLYPDNSACSSIVFLDSDRVVVQAWKLWQAWQKSKLADRSPNQAPVIKNPVELRKRTSPATYVTLTQHFDGNRSLRDLAVQKNQDLLQFTNYLMWYVQLELVQLVDIPDFPKCLNSVQKKKDSSSGGKLIACIDKNITVCQRLENVIRPAGYDFIGSNDELQAIKLFLSKKPDLIFIDGDMIGSGGHKVYHKIQKISSLRKIPIILLIQNSKIFNHLQARVEGFSEILTKPVKVQQVLGTINKHLHKPAIV